MPDFQNPFRPGAGHPPPYLAGREAERAEFQRLLEQTTILDNLVLTGLRGVGKTVLLDALKPMAIDSNWLWTGTDLSESASISEDNLAVRICTDLSLLTEGLVVHKEISQRIGFGGETTEIEHTLNFHNLLGVYKQTPGLAMDKLKAVLELAWQVLSENRSPCGIIFAYDEAQNLSDSQKHGQYPLALLLDTFQGIQKMGMPLMLVLTGLPTLFPGLVESRTFAERMFRVAFVDRLTRSESRDAILKPIDDASCPVQLTEESVETICDISDGYPYFIQFICREVYDSFMQKMNGRDGSSVPVKAIEQKLDTDFFAGRWARATDRQRQLLSVIAQLENCDDEFTIQEIVDLSGQLLEKPFGGSQVNQMLAAMSGLVFKNRRGRYSFAVPLLGRFIRRQLSQG